MTTTPPIDPVREKFEQFAAERGYSLIKNGNPRQANYMSSPTYDAWVTFQFAYASGHEAGKREERERLVPIIETFKANGDAARELAGDLLIQRIEGAK